MAIVRPRRMQRFSRGVGLARVGAPAAAALLVTAGIAIAVSPAAQQTVTAEPAAPTTISTNEASLAARQADRASRAQAARPSLTTAAAAEARAAAAAKAAAVAKARVAAAAKKRAALQAAAVANREAAAARKAAAERREAAAARRTAAAAAADRREAIVPRAVGTRFTTATLNVRTRAAAGAAVTAVLETGSKVAITASADGQWQQILRNGKAGWVRAEYLSAKKPAPARKTAAGVSNEACASGSAVESGLTPDAIRVHRAICARFPQITSFGGVRADSLPEHPSGRALDAMVSDSSLGWQIANYIQDNRRQLGVSEVLYSQKIWTVQRGSEGWRSMSDRGSASANHYDHVHITVYGSSGTA